MKEGCVDASALVALFLGEGEAEGLSDRLREFDRLFVSPPTLVETRIVLTRRLGRDVKADVDELLARFGIEVGAFSSAHADAAQTAFLAYGKGRHPADLNYGDCMAYAAAKVAGAELVYVGDDFARTDLA